MDLIFGPNSEMILVDNDGTRIVLTNEDLKNLLELYINYNIVSSNNDQMMVCYHCNYTSVTLGKLRNHIFKKHLKGRAKSFHKKQNPDLNIVNTSTEVLDDDDYVQLINETIQENIYEDNMNQALSIQHGKLNSKGRKYVYCTVCPYRCLESGCLKRHVMTKHTREKPFHCSFCTFRTVSQTSLKRHVIAKHTEEKPFACDYCDYRTSMSTVLKRHIMSRHTDEKPFACLYCDYRTVLQNTLKGHIMAVHTKEKPYACAFCDYRTSESGNLKRHLSIHTGEKQYACELCSYRTSETSNLKRHMIRHNYRPSIQA